MHSIRSLKKFSLTLTGALTGALVLATLAAPPAAVAQEKVKIVFGTNWLAQAEHGGFYQALASGLYDKAGLDVEIVMGGPQVNTAANLIGGRLDIAMISNSFIPLNFVKENIPFKAVASSFQKDPQVLMSHPELGITSLADMKDRPILISADARESYWLFLKAAFDFTDDQIRPYSFTIAPFLADEDAIQQGFITNEPFIAQANGVNPDVFLLADNGYESYANLIVTSNKLIEEQPDVVRRFVEASEQGWVDFLTGDNSGAIALIKEANPDYTDELAANTIGAMKANGIVLSGDALTLGMGAMTRERWQSFFDTMVAAGVYDPDLDWQSAFTLEFTNDGIGVN